MNIRPKPSITDDYNARYEFKVDDYNVKIIIDELNDNLIVTYGPEASEWTSCTCKDYEYRHRLCKHIKAVLTLLEGYEVDLRPPENPIEGS